jgi:hypothetical protein
MNIFDINILLDIGLEKIMVLEVYQNQMIG